VIDPKPGGTANLAEKTGKSSHPETGDEQNIPKLVGNSGKAPKKSLGDSRFRVSRSWMEERARCPLEIIRSQLEGTPISVGNVDPKPV